MQTSTFAAATLLLLAVTLAGCQPEPVADAVASNAPATVDTPNPAVRSAKAPREASPEGLATQPGPNGSEVTLRAVRVTGNLLTVELSYQAAADRSLSKTIRLADVSLIDDSTTQRYEVVQDDSGRYMAQPLGSSGKSLLVNLGKGDTGQVSFRFPAPPPDSKTVSISIPEVGAFDGMPVQR